MEKLLENSLFPCLVCQKSSKFPLLFLALRHRSFPSRALDYQFKSSFSLIVMWKEQASTYGCQVFLWAMSSFKVFCTSDRVTKCIFLCLTKITWVSLAALRKRPRFHSSLLAHWHSGMKHQPCCLWAFTKFKAAGKAVTGIISRCSRCSSQEQMEKFWMTKDPDPPPERSDQN